MNSALLALIREDMRPALGVTEPAAIALACAKARSLSDEAPERIQLRVNSGIYKNAYTCGIPNTEKLGNAYAAALGCLAGDADRALFVLDGIKREDVERSERMIAQGRVQIEIEGIGSDLYINAQVITAHDSCEAEIRHDHTNLCYLRVNDRVLLDRRDAAQSAAADLQSAIAGYTLADFHAFASQADARSLEFIRQAYIMNNALADAALASPRCVFAKSLLALNGGRRISDDAERSSVLIAAAAAEARVLGLNYPAMSITGSGNHGIISTLPLFAAAKVEGHSDPALLRATALSYLITMYVKHYSGKLSAFCGCAVAAGTGMACALTMLRGGALAEIESTLYNMANSITGMICHGGNHGCVMKVVAAVKTGFSASEMGLAGARIERLHGIGGSNAEQTMRNIAYIADPGMVETEKAILHILAKKAADSKETKR